MKSIKTISSLIIVLTFESEFITNLIKIQYNVVCNEFLLV